jgi:hypothetical protein
MLPCGSQVYIVFKSKQYHFKCVSSIVTVNFGDFYLDMRLAIYLENFWIFTVGSCKIVPVNFDMPICLPLHLQ